MNDELKAWLRSHGVDPDRNHAVAEEPLPKPRAKALMQTSLEERIAQVDMAALQAYAGAPAVRDRGGELYMTAVDVLAFECGNAALSNLDATPQDAAKLQGGACWLDVSKSGRVAVDAVSKNTRWLLSWSVGQRVRIDCLPALATDPAADRASAGTWHEEVLRALQGWRAALPEGDAKDWLAALGDGHTLGAAWCRVGLYRWLQPLDAASAVAAILRGELVKEQEAVREWALALGTGAADHVDRELSAAFGHLEHELVDVVAQLSAEPSSSDPARRLGHAMERAAILSAGASLLWGCERGQRSEDAWEALQEQGVGVRETMTPTLDDVVRRRLSGLPASPDDWWVP